MIHFTLKKVFLEQVFLVDVEHSRVNYSMVVQRNSPKRKNVFKPCDLNT